LALSTPEHACDVGTPNAAQHGGPRAQLTPGTTTDQTDSLAAAVAVMRTYAEEGTTARLHEVGERLAAGVRTVAAGLGVADHVLVRGRASNLVFATLDENLRPSPDYRTLFMRQLSAGGVLGPSFVVSSAPSEEDIDRTVDVVARACVVYRKALDAGDPAAWMGGGPVKPVFRHRLWTPVVESHLPGGEFHLRGASSPFGHARSRVRRGARPSRERLPEP
jgi:glutamate-1-semialdehyde 2,1-aminomutase